ncbi:MAG: efflux RND transporter periplasmic adaptor subunit [Deltaproteobacteria bacterium]|nr:efflux RND transporter periplasmic adaptor subunit [Deltaproteobacteria bacterium]
MQKKTNVRLWVATIAGLLAIVAALGGIKAGQIGAMIAMGKSFTPPPESVTSARVQSTQWQPSRAAVGSLVAVRGVTVSAEVVGTIRAIGFDSGAPVKKGEILVQLDTSVEQAQLASAEADAALARLNLARARELHRAEAAPQAELDVSEARAKQAEAVVAGLQAAIARKTIRAPFDGRVAIRQVELGQVVSPGTPIASIQSVDPMYADFWLPQQALAEVKVGQQVKVRTDTFPGATWEGSIAAVNSEVDPTSRNVRIRARLANPEGRLRPGMFVQVEALSAGPHPVLAIPATAVLFAPYGDSVYALEEKKDPGGRVALVAKQKFVRLGERRGDLVAVAQGLAEGDTIVSSGAFKLRNGAEVVVHNDLAPDARADPRPVDP